jgi:hypothetical protein
MSMAESLFKITLQLANFSGCSVMEIRRQAFNDVFYLFAGLSAYDLSDLGQQEEQPDSLAAYEPHRRKRFADEVDWFN